MFRLQRRRESGRVPLSHAKQPGGKCCSCVAAVASRNTSKSAVTCYTTCLNAHRESLKAIQRVGQSNKSSTSSNVGAAILSALLLSVPAPALAEVYEGSARIVDGDTLYVKEQKFRLYAIDAPEKAQYCSTPKGQDYACGQVSLNALKDHVGNNPVRCETKSKDQYGRNVGICYLVQGKQTEDLNGWMVSNGFAVAYR